MGTGEFELVIQLGGKGYHGQLTLEAEPANNVGAVAIEFERNANCWKSGATNFDEATGQFTFAK